MGWLVAGWLAGWVSLTGYQMYFKKKTKITSTSTGQSDEVREGLSSPG